MRLTTYVLATAIGIVPAMIVGSLIGDGLGAVLASGGKVDLDILYEPRFLAPLVGLAILVLLPVLYKKLCRRRRVDE